MHKLLARQLRQAAAGSPAGEVDLARLIALVDAAYEESDRERRLKDHAIAVMEDEVRIADRRAIEEAEARFNLLMDNVGEAVVVIDGRGRIEAFNHEAEHIFGYDAAEIVGQNVAVLMPREMTALHDAFLDHSSMGSNSRVLGGGGRELRGRRKNGEVFPTEIAIGEVASGGHRQFIGVIRDITARRQAEMELRESESRFRDLAGSASDWFWESDSEHRLTFVSERIGGVLGVKPAAILGHTWFEIGLDDRPDRAAAHRNDLRARAAFRDLVFTVGPPDGKDSKVIRLSGIPVFSPGDGFIGYRGVGADITRETAAAERAAQAQKQLSDAINSLADAIAVYDGNERLAICNRAYIDTLGGGDDFIMPGISFEEVLRTGQSRGYFDTDGQDFESWLGERLRRFRRADGESFVIKLSGGRWVQSRECPTSEGGVVAVRTDITGLKRREEELDRLRRRYELILDSAGEGIVGLDEGGRVIFANHMAGEIIGRDTVEMIGRCFHCQVVSDPSACDGPCSPPSSPLVEACRSGAPGQVMDQVFRGMDSQTVPVDYFVAPIIEDGRPSGAVLVFRDATLRLQYERSIEEQQRELAQLVAERTHELRREIDVRARAEIALRASRERLKGITDNLFEGVLVVDREGYVAFANPSARQVLEWDEERGDIEGYPIDILLRLRTPAGDVDFAQSPFRRALVENRGHHDDDAALVTASGRTLSVAYACSPLGEEEGRRSVIISFRNIEALKKAQRDSVQASRLAGVGQLASGIAHEINTPIQYVGDNLRFIRDSLDKLVAALEAAGELATSHPVPEAVERFGQVLSKAKISFLTAELPAAVSESMEGIGQIARIVLSMKEFSHPGTGNKTMADINRALDSTLTVSRNVWKHVAEVERRFDPDLPRVLCRAGELNQVFLNLIVNAAHAVEASGKPLPGRIIVSTRPDGDHVVVSVEDSGGGVPDSIRERIFDPFFTTKDVGKGTGQGLAICRDVVVTKHGGSLDLGDGEGGGALFTVRLPVNDADRPGGES